MDPKVLKRRIDSGVIQGELSEVCSCSARRTILSEADAILERLLVNVEFVSRFRTGKRVYVMTLHCGDYLGISPMKFSPIPDEIRRCCIEAGFRIEIDRVAPETYTMFLVIRDE